MDKAEKISIVAGSIILATVVGASLGMFVHIINLY